MDRSFQGCYTHQIVQSVDGTSDGTGASTPAGEGDTEPEGKGKHFLNVLGHTGQG